MRIIEALRQAEIPTDQGMKPFLAGIEAMLQPLKSKGWQITPMGEDFMATLGKARLDVRYKAARLSWSAYWPDTWNLHIPGQESMHAEGGPWGNIGKGQMLANSGKLSLKDVGKFEASLKKVVSELAKGRK